MEAEIFLDELDYQIVHALADNRMVMRQASKATEIHSSTLRDRILAIRKKTGLDPLNFYDLYKLVTTAKQVMREAPKEEMPQSRSCKIRVLRPVPVFHKYAPRVGKVFDAVYNPGHKRCAPFCVIQVLDRKIVLRQGEFEIVGE